MIGCLDTRCLHQEEGLCDCGDREAWKCDPYCDTHILGADEEGETASKAIDNLTADLVE